MEDELPSYNLVSELESLGASVLITSRNKIPFTQLHQECKITPSGEDIHAFVNSALQKGPLKRVLESQPDLASEVATEISENADGMFLRPALILQGLERCKRAVDVKKQLARMSGSLNDMYKGIIEHIKENEPGLMALIFYVYFADSISSKIDFDAMQEYLAFAETLDTAGPPEDYLRPVDAVLDACRGLLVLRPRYAAQKHTPQFQQLQFCHPSARDFIKSLPTSELHAAHLQLVSTLLRYTPSILAHFCERSSTAQISLRTTECRDPSSNITSSLLSDEEFKFLQDRNPHLSRSEDWMGHVLGVQEDVDWKPIKTSFPVPGFCTYFVGSNDGRGTSLPPHHKTCRPFFFQSMDLIRCCTNTSANPLQTLLI
jgi:hypothetical protein